MKWSPQLFFRTPEMKAGYWRSNSNQRNYLKERAKELNIQRPSDWGKITIKQFVSKKSGWSLLYYHGGSLFRALSANFPGTQFSI